MVRLADTPDDLSLGLPPVVEVDEAAARRSLREQIARLERELAECFISAFAEQADDVTVALPAPARRSGPRLLSLGELEALRDDLAARLGDARAAFARRADEQEANRVLLEKMRLEPARHKWVRLSNADMGEPGCWSWHVRPRLGLIGMLAGWWHVKLSSGCPLAP